MRNQPWGLATHGGVPAPPSGEGHPPRSPRPAGLLSVPVVPSHAVRHPGCEVRPGDSRLLSPHGPGPSDRGALAPRAQAAGKWRCHGGGREPALRVPAHRPRPLVSESSGSRPGAGDLGHTRGTGAPPPPLPPELGPLCRQVCSGCHVCPHEHDRPISHLPVIGGDVRSVFRAAARIRIGLFSLLLEASLQEGHAASAISRGRALRGRRSALRCVSSLRPRPPSSQTPTLLAGASLVLTLSSRLGRTLP